MEKRIAEYEIIFDKLLSTIRKLDNSLLLLEGNEKELQQLKTYYGSKEWFQDLEEYEKSTKKIKAGVLSEDGVWNMLEDLQEILIRMQKISKRLLEENKMKTFVLASNNKHKIKEFKEILTEYNILSLSDINFNEDIEETGETFEENALIKARTIHEFLKKEHPEYLVIAEDSGLCCEALDGEPGVYSARYAGNHDNQANRDKLRKELEGQNHSAFFNCTIVVYYPNDTYKVFNGKTYGTIIDEEKGDKSFGYDCIFLSDDLNKTFGEATEEEKNSVSHRGRAIENMLKEL